MKPERLKNVSIFLSNLKMKLLGGYSILNKFFFISLALAALGWYFFDSIAAFLVNDSRVKQTVINSLNAASGRQTSVNGDVKFTTKPEPYIEVKDIVIANLENVKSSENFAEIGEISTKPDLLSLARGKVGFDELIVKNTKIFIEENDNKDKAFYNITKEFFSSSTDYNGKKISFRELEINFHKKSNIADSQGYIRRKLDFAELTLDPSPPEGGYTIKGAINFNPTRELYYFSINFESGIGKDSDFKARIYSNDTDVSFEGTANTEGKIELNGELSGKISAFSYKLLNAIGFGDDVTDSIRIDETANISGAVSISENQISVKALKAKSDIIDITVNSETDITEKYFTSLSINVPYLDYTKLLKTRKEQIAIRRASVIEKEFTKRLQSFPLFALGDDINFSLDFNLSDIKFFGGKAGNIIAQINQNDNLFSIDKLEMNLPGNSVFKTLSKIQVGKKNLEMNGELALALYGSKLDDLALALGIINDPNNTPGLGVFYFRTKGFLSGKKIHFKEILAKINDNKFAGQMIIDYEKQFAASSAFNFDKLELDRYIVKKENQEVYQDSFSDNIDFLRFIDSVFDELKIAVTATNLTKSGENLRDFALYAQVNPGITRITDLYFLTKEFGVFRGNAVVDINDFQPRVDVNIKVDKFDFDYIKYGRKDPENDKYSFTGKWDNKPISFEDLGYMQGKMSLAIDKFKVFHNVLEGFRTSLDLQGSKIIINDSKFESFGNKIDFKGEMTTEYPSFSISFISADLDIKSFMKNIFNIDEVHGKFNVSGILASTGYSMDQMVKSARGRIEIITNGFKVEGFDLDGLSKNIIEAKRMEQAKQIGMEYLDDGETIFGPLSASFGVNEGKLFFSNLDMNILKLNTAAKSSGSINLMKWTMNVDTGFDIKTIDGFNIPLELETTGRVGRQELSWNEDILTKYWEDKFYGVNPERKGKSNRQ